MIPGLRYFKNFITEDEEKYILDYIDGNPWTGRGMGANPQMKRLTQHYGYTFSYQNRCVDNNSKALEIPKFCDTMFPRMKEYGLPLSSEPFNMVIVNEYLPGQGIMPHVDAPIFGKCIASLSLLSPCVMKFERVDKLDDFRIMLEPRSLIVMQGDARYIYKHSISKNLQENFNGETIERKRRISLTFRSLKSSE
ncbi:alkylated DNA repair protein [Rozella allomycis CSF55]|uniref:Alkylated DNA repair protein n=1 Tax=Rozella allomycis (strain CSF55) TaxID=988480 RepID=A0A4P9YGU5_ROZAC|nr:alkylated DNA repair protein [Rozella allomycis CSF55]